MSKQYYVICGSRVVYPSGHYDYDGAEATAQAFRKLHPNSEVTIVEIVQTYSSLRAQRKARKAAGLPVNA